MLLSTHSRASLLALITAILFGNAKNYLSLIKRNKLISVLLLLSSVFLIIFSYFFKKDSADGRILIWNVDLLIIKDNILFGIYPKKYSAIFCEYQSYFFENNPLFNNYLSGNGEFSFNEFLGLTVQFGIFGLFLFLLVIVYILIKASYKLNNIYIKSAFMSFICILTFSLFSYPFSTLPIVHVLIISIAVVSTEMDKIALLKLTKKINIMILLSSFYLTYNCLFAIKKEYENLYVREKAETMLILRNYPKAKYYMDLISPFYLHDGVFLLEYGQALLGLKKINESIVMLEEATNYSCNPQTYIALAIAYSENGFCEKSESALLQASKITPYLFYPKYLLFNLYKELGLHNNAMKIAKDISQMKVKVNSPKVAFIKAEISKFK